MIDISTVSTCSCSWTEYQRLLYTHTAAWRRASCASMRPVPWSGAAGGASAQQQGTVAVCAVMAPLNCCPAPPTRRREPHFADLHARAPWPALTCCPSPPPLPRLPALITSLTGRAAIHLYRALTTATACARSSSTATAHSTKVTTNRCAPGLSQIACLLLVLLAAPAAAAAAAAVAAVSFTYNFVTCDTCRPYVSS